MQQKTHPIDFCADFRDGGPRVGQLIPGSCNFFSGRPSPISHPQDQCGFKIRDPHPRRGSRSHIHLGCQPHSPTLRQTIDRCINTTTGRVTILFSTRYYSNVTSNSPPSWFYVTAHYKRVLGLCWNNEFLTFLLLPWMNCWKTSLKVMNDMIII